MIPTRLRLERLETRLTPATASVVRDVFAGPGSSGPFLLTASGGNLFFTANDSDRGSELWTSDGTAAGTRLVADVRPGPDSSGINWVTDANGVLFFVADDGVSGPELWRSDGTAAGTYLVRDARPGPTGSEPMFLTNVNGVLFFAADDGVNGRELWTSDGTTAGTYMVRDLEPGPNGSDPNGLRASGNLLYFSATDAAEGYELWRSDGSFFNTFRTPPIYPGPTSSSPGRLTDVNGTLFFAAASPNQGVELYRADAVTGSNVLVRDIHPGVGNSANPSWLTNLNGTLYFAADDGVNGAELWRSDGTADGTALVRNVNPGTPSSSPAFLAAAAGRLFFTADDGTVGRELWATDGTTGGTAIVRDIAAGSTLAPPTPLTAVGGRVYFPANDGVNGTELWVSDGTAAGTVLVADTSLAAGNGLPNFVTHVNGSVFFAATGPRGRELYRLDDAADSFDRANSTTLGPAWTEPAGNLSVLDGELVGTGGFNLALATVLTAADARVFASVSLPTTGVARADVALRATADGKNAYLGSVIGNNGIETAVIRRLQNGVLTTLASAAVRFPVGEGSLRFEAVGTTLRLSIDGRPVLAAVDATFTSGRTGVGGTGLAAFADFYASAVPAVPAAFGDAFGRPADTTSPGGPWRELLGDAAVVNKRLVLKANGATVAAAANLPAQRDVSVSAVVSAYSPAGSNLTGAAGLLARYSGVGDRDYYLGLIVGVNGVYSARILKNVGGVFTALANVPVAFGAGVLRFEAVGSSLKLFINDGLVARAIDTSLARPGLAGVRGTYRATYDDFRLDPLAAAPVYDGFNRAAASTLGPQWLTLAGTVQIDAGSARVAADNSVAVIHGITRTAVVVEASLRRPSATTDNAYVAFRVVNAANYYYAGYNTPGTFAIYRVVNGVTTKLAVSVGPPIPLPPGPPPAFAERIRVVASGSTLRLIRGTSIVVEAIDATFAAGAVGIVGNNGGRIEDYVVA